MIHNLQRALASWRVSKRVCSLRLVLPCAVALFALLQTLSTFPEEVCEGNLKAVNALQGVDASTMKRVRHAHSPKAPSCTPSMPLSAALRRVKAAAMIVQCRSEHAPQYTPSEPHVLCFV